MDLKFMLNFYKKKKLLRTDEAVKSLAEGYLKKARNNLVGMHIDYDISANEKTKKMLNVSDFQEYDWVVVKGYYAMYMAVLACLAKIGLKSENHNASIYALEFYFVRKGKLEEEYLELLKNVSLEKEYVDDLKHIKEDRKTAQYDVSGEFQKRKAEEIMENAEKFVDRLENVFYKIK